MVMRARRYGLGLMVRKGGLEPPRYCYRQPLKLVRLPIPPLPRGVDRSCRRYRYFAGAGVAGAGVAGAGVAGAGAGVGGGAGVVVRRRARAPAGDRPPITEPGPRWPMMPSTSAPTMNSTAQTVVARDSTVAPLRAPNAAWLAPPPNALAMSPPLPCCSRMTSISTRQTRT